MKLCVISPLLALVGCSSAPASDPAPADPLTQIAVGDTLDASAEAARDAAVAPEAAPAPAPAPTLPPGAPAYSGPTLHWCVTIGLGGGPGGELPGPLTSQASACVLQGENVFDLETTGGAASLVGVNVDGPAFGVCTHYGPSSGAHGCYAFAVSDPSTFVRVTAAAVVTLGYGAGGGADPQNNQFGWCWGAEAACGPGTVADVNGACCWGAIQHGGAPVPPGPGIQDDGTRYAQWTTTTLPGVTPAP